MSKGRTKPPRHRQLAILTEAIPAFKELDEADPRTCAVVGLAFVENNLALCLLNRFVAIDAAYQRNIFDEPSAPLSNFSAKIEMGYLLNVFGTKAKEDLKLLNRIRNRFAHYLEVRDFDHPEVAGMCDQLQYPKYSMKTEVSNGGRRERYAGTISHFISRFALESKHVYRPLAHTVRVGADY